MSQCVDELRRRREIGLVCGHDVAARVALRRIAKRRVEELDIGPFAEWRDGIPNRASTGRSRSAATGATTTASTSSAAWRLIACLLARELRAVATLRDRPLDLRDIARRRRPRIAAALLDLV